uniref:Uncharacterized protein n=1 Tax=viral metagenome TaxID=1070528 RepID=A0A6C0BLG9_9ZZZZ
MTTKIKRLIVVPRNNDIEYIGIIDVASPYKTAIKTRVSVPKVPIVAPIRQLIENDVICHPIYTCDRGMVVNCRTKFNGNRKTYQVDDTTYEVEFRF